LRNWRRKNWSSSILPELNHLITLTDDVGVIQHAVEDVPNRATGYCTDDVSRAFMVVLARLDIDPHDTMAERMAAVYLSFLHDAQLEDGRFHNFMSYERTWMDAVGTHDSVGRALWSLGYGMRFGQRGSWRRVSKRLFDKGLAAADWLQYPRAQAYAIIGLSHALASSIADGEIPQYRAILRRLADQLKERYLEVRGADWQWFENLMTYDNARLPEALLRAGLALQDDEFIAIGLRTFEFYRNVTVENGVFIPIGNEGWYHRGGPRPRYCQQPLEAVSLIDAALVALDATGDPAYRATAQIGLDWYHGRNTRGIVMARNGGCLDGLNETSVNMNMGAESTLAYLAGAYALAERPAQALTIAR
jgi:hypothetical protein